MPLHRDIHWIGRQWAVTGLGMQLIDQKLKGFFDIEASRLWEEALIETTRAKEWLNVADFEKGLEVARNRFPAGGVTPSPPAEKVAPAPPRRIVDSCGSSASHADCAEVAMSASERPDVSAVQSLRPSAARADRVRSQHLSLLLHDQCRQNSTCCFQVTRNSFVPGASG